jgi:hypothetical protein
MKKKRIHICLVSDRNILNITPVLDRDISPEKVILCSTESMMNNAVILKTFLDKKSVTSEIFRLGDIFDFYDFKKAFQALNESIRSYAADTAVNLTCGSKIMILAAQCVFGGNCEMFYIYPESDLAVVITDSSEPESLYDLEDKITLTDYFELHGYKVRSIERRRVINESSGELFTTLVSSINRYAEPLGVLNYLATNAENNNSLTFSCRISEKAFEVLELFQKHGAVKSFDENSVTFRDTASRAFCNGLWLEDYVYEQLSAIDKIVGLQDYAVSLNIENRNGVRNEIDVAFLYNNRLYLIECKTSRMDEKGTDIVYKMDTVKGYAGLKTRGILVSYRKLKRFDIQRAEDLDIMVLARSSIAPEHFINSIIELIKCGRNSI